jgi:hypothetical protein
MFRVIDDDEADLLPEVFGNHDADRECSCRRCKEHFKAIDEQIADDKLEEMATILRRKRRR